MPISVGPVSTETRTVAEDEIVARAHELVPLLRERAREAELARQVPSEVIAAAAEAQLFEVLVPRRWGGLGLSMPTLWELARVLSHGDMSAAWTICFLIEHNWMAARMPWTTQEELYADRTYILAAAPLAASTGNAVAVDGGFRVTGRWPYASAIPNANWSFVLGMVDGERGPEPRTFLIPASEFTVHDDWHFSGMAATGSATISGEDIFVPEQYSLPAGLFLSPDHPGVAHDEDSMGYLILTALPVMTAGFAIGGAERMLELARERLVSTKIMGTARIDQVLSRSRWAAAAQQVKCARLLYDELVAETTARGPGWWPEVDGAQQQLDTVTVIHMCKDAARLMIDGMGTSAYQVDNPLQRYLRDMDVLASHATVDWDNAHERAARLVLGLERLPTDPPGTDQPTLRQAASTTGTAF